MKIISVDIADETIENNAEQINESFKFTGSTSEYYKIWIVNVCLSILTLGIYSAWAKVRTIRYFYGNTHLAGTSFDYLAKPESVLKGRLLTALFFNNMAKYFILYPRIPIPFSFCNNIIDTLVNDKSIII